MQAIYKYFSKVYDTMQYDIDYDHWFQSLERCVKAYGNKGNAVLELACGTGTLAIYFSKAGYHVSGVDLSEGMLDEAKKKARKDGQLIDFYQQNIVDLSLNQSFDVIYSMCDGFNYLLTKEALKASFEKIARHLNPEGLFIFDLSTHYKLKNVIGNETFAETFEDSAYIWENEYDEAEKRLNFLLTLFMKTEGAYQRFEEYHIQTSYEVEEIKVLMDPSLEILKVLDGDTFGPLEKNAHRVCFVMKKRKQTT